MYNEPINYYVGLSLIAAYHDNYILLVSVIYKIYRIGFKGQ